VRILWTGDTHGQLAPIYHRDVYGVEFLREHGITQGSVEAYLTSSEGYVGLARRYGKVGGYAHLAALVERERSAYPERTLLLDAGDAWYGSAIALLTEGSALVEVMNALRYDAMTLHWEFNLGKEILLARVRQARFAVLAQNLVDTEIRRAAAAGEYREGPGRRAGRGGGPSIPL
jgi:sulfur-oxidizing protein SoxB